MNWGFKIIFAYSLFVLGIGYLVIKSMNQENELVVTDYYAQELKYQDKLEAAKHAASLPEPIQIESSNGHIIIKFPGKNGIKTGEGMVKIYCASDKSKDYEMKFNLELDSLIDVPYQGYGTRSVQISWTTNGLDFFTEKNIFIQ